MSLHLVGNGRAVNPRVQRIVAALLPKVRAVAVVGRAALVRSWPVLNFLYRASFAASVFLFSFIWLACLGVQPGFDRVASNLSADLQPLAQMAAAALAHACHFTLLMLSRLPLIVGLPVALLLLSFPISALVRFLRANRGRA